NFLIFVVQNASVVDTSDLQTELERTKERFENGVIKKEKEYAKLWNDWYKKCDECKYDKISYDKAYKDMQQKIERLQAQLGNLKGKFKDTSCVFDTPNQLSHKLESANVELEFQVFNYARENAHLKTTYKNLFDSISVSRLDNTKTRRPQPRSNRVPSVSKSSRNKNKEAEVEEHHRNLLLSKNNKHISSACNNVKIDSQDEHVKVLQHLSIESLDFSLGGHRLAKCLTQQANLLLPVTPKVMLTALMVIMLVPLTQWNLKSNGFQILLLCLASYPNLFVVRRFRLFQAHDMKSKASHQFHVEVFGNCPLRE
nr:hypothetical protein [Tanacetum cinerariifolium]